MSTIESKHKDAAMQILGKVDLMHLLQLQTKLDERLAKKQVTQNEHNLMTQWICAAINKQAMTA